MSDLSGRSIISFDDLSYNDVLSIFETADEINKKLGFEAIKIGKTSKKIPKHIKDRRGLEKLFREFRFDNAEGGRIGFKKGSFDPTKRKFLKGAGAGLGVLSMLPFVGKFFKPAAKAAKALTKVPIEQTGGMPVWFPKLVNKVVNEGTDVTKKLATVERETVHTTKIGAKGTYAGDEVTVYRNLDSGNVRVEYGPPLLDEGRSSKHLPRRLSAES